MKYRYSLIIFIFFLVSCSPKLEEKDIQELLKQENYDTLKMHIQEYQLLENPSAYDLHNLGYLQFQIWKSTSMHATQELEGIIESFQKSFQILGHPDTKYNIDQLQHLLKDLQSQHPSQEIEEESQKSDEIANKQEEEKQQSHENSQKEDQNSKQGEDEKNKKTEQQSTDTGNQEETEENTKNEEDTGKEDETQEETEENNENTGNQEEAEENTKNVEDTGKEDETQEEGSENSQMQTNPRDTEVQNTEENLKKLEEQSEKILQQQEHLQKQIEYYKNTPNIQDQFEEFFMGGSLFRELEGQKQKDW